MYNTTKIRFPLPSQVSGDRLAALIAGLDNELSELGFNAFSFSYRQGGECGVIEISSLSPPPQKAKGYLKSLEGDGTTVEFQDCPEQSVKIQL